MIAADYTAWLGAAIGLTVTPPQFHDTRRGRHAIDLVENKRVQLIEPPRACPAVFWASDANRSPAERVSLVEQRS